MNKEDYKEIVEEALKVLSEPPPGKTKRTSALLGIPEEELLSALNDKLRANWQVRNPVKEQVKTALRTLSDSEPPPGKTKRSEVIELVSGSTSLSADQVDKVLDQAVVELRSNLDWAVL